MRWAIAGWFIGFSFATSELSWAKEPGVVTPEELEQGQVMERNTYHSEDRGFSITKPDGWVLDTKESLQEQGREQIPIFPGSTSVKYEGLIAVVAPFPSGTEWLLVAPRVQAESYQLLAPALAEQLMNSALRETQAGISRQAQVLLEPVTVTINGKNWVRAGFTSKAPAPDLSNPKATVDLYEESYMHVSGNRFFVVHFTARPVDVPTYRKEVDSIIQSMTIREPNAGSESATARKEL